MMSFVILSWMMLKLLSFRVVTRPYLTIRLRVSMAPVVGWLVSLVAITRTEGSVIHRLLLLINSQTLNMKFHNNENGCILFYNPLKLVKN